MVWGVASLVFFCSHRCSHIKPVMPLQNANENTQTWTAYGIRLLRSKNSNLKRPERSLGAPTQTAGLFINFDKIKYNSIIKELYFTGFTQEQGTAYVRVPPRARNWDGRHFKSPRRLTPFEFDSKFFILPQRSRLTSHGGNCSNRSVRNGRGETQVVEKGIRTQKLLDKSVNWGWKVSFKMYKVNHVHTPWNPKLVSSILFFWPPFVRFGQRTYPNYVDVYVSVRRT